MFASILKLSRNIKVRISSLLIVATALSLTACFSPYTNDDILCEYKDFNSLYYAKNEYTNYKYSDYIYDDISNGEYKKSTPNIADYKNGPGALDYDIPAYVTARTDFILKKELIDKYEVSVAEICAAVRDDYFKERKAHVYYYDKSTKKNSLLYDGLVSNLSYDNELPYISFDIDDSGVSPEEEFAGRKILLSDIIAANSTIDGFMRVIIGSSKKRLKFFMDKEMEVDLSTASEIG